MEKHDGSSCYDTAFRTDGDSMLYPFVLINGYKEHIGTVGIKFKIAEECLAAGARWMNLDRETQLAMLTKPDYPKFV